MTEHFLAHRANLIEELDAARLEKVNVSATVAATKLACERARGQLEGYDKRIRTHLRGEPTTAEIDIAQHTARMELRSLEGDATRAKLTEKLLEERIQALETSIRQIDQIVAPNPPPRAIVHTVEPLPRPEVDPEEPGRRQRAQDLARSILEEAEIEI